MRRQPGNQGGEQAANVGGAGNEQLPPNSFEAAFRAGVLGRIYGQWPNGAVRIIAYYGQVDPDDAHSKELVVMLGTRKDILIPPTLEQSYWDSLGDTAFVFAGDQVGVDHETAMLMRAFTSMVDSRTIEHVTKQADAQAFEEAYSTVGARATRLAEQGGYDPSLADLGDALQSALPPRPVTPQAAPEPTE